MADAASPVAPGLGFPKSLRLRKRAEFRRAQAGGKRAVSANLVVLWIDNGGPGARFGLTVSRKVGNAVVRNRVKRWLREAIRHERHGLTGVDVVFIARGGAATAGLASLSDEVRRHLRAIGKERRR